MFEFWKAREIDLYGGNCSHCNAILFLGLHTSELDLHGGITTEEIDHHFDSSFSGIHFDDFAFTAFEWTALHDDIVPDLHIRSIFFTFFCEYPFELLEFITTNWDRNSTSTKKSCHIGCIAHDVPALIGDDHLDEDISWEYILLALYLLATGTDRDGVMCRHKYIENILFESKCLSALHE